MDDSHEEAIMDIEGDMPIEETREKLLLILKKPMLFGFPWGCSKPREEFGKDFNKMMEAEAQKALCKLDDPDFDLNELDKIMSWIDWLKTDFCEEHFEGYLDDLWRELEDVKKTTAEEASRAGLQIIKEMGAKEADIFFLNHQGYSQRKIAGKLKCSPSKINAILKKLEQKGLRIMKYKGGAGDHVGNYYRKNKTIMNRIHHNPD